jgi:hypothetical protein
VPRRLQPVVVGGVPLARAQHPYRVGKLIPVLLRFAKILKLDVQARAALDQLLPDRLVRWAAATERGVTRVR